jgi:hypothetical protein
LALLTGVTTQGGAALTLGYGVKPLRGWVAGYGAWVAGNDGLPSGATHRSPITDHRSPITDH